MPHRCIHSAVALYALPLTTTQPAVLSLSLLPFLLATTLKTFIPILTSTHFASINLYETANPWGKSGAQRATENCTKREGEERRYKKEWVEILSLRNRKYVCMCVLKEKVCRSMVFFIEMAIHGLMQFIAYAKYH